MSGPPDFREIFGSETKSHQGGSIKKNYWPKILHHVMAKPLTFN